MKKLSALLIVLSLFVGFSSTSLYAKAIGIKAGYTMPKDDIGKYDNDFNIGVYFDMGSFLINSLDFRPGIDTFTLTTKSGDYADVWGIHLDWYWHFMQKGSIAPFIGFGPTLNYYNFKNDAIDGDSDAGVELFIGSDFKIGGTPLSLMVEGRFKVLDIAALGDKAWQINLGIAYNF